MVHGKLSHYGGVSHGGDKYSHNYNFLIILDTREIKFLVIEN